jgi:hypothetical protein
MKIKKNLSFDEKIVSLGEKKSEQLGMTFSGYITYLILKDNGEIAVTIETKK